MERCRRDINAFCEFVIKDAAGDRIRQAAIHRSWHEFIARAKKAGKHALIVAPWGHGKSVQIVISLALFELGRNPNLRVKIVSCDDDLAAGRVQTIKAYIEEDADYRAVFPNVLPQRKAEWTKHSIIVERSAPMPDPSVAAKGILGSAIGGRCDLLLVDDPHNLKTGVLEPSSRESVKEAFKIWLSRLEPGAMCIYIATVWHEEDLTHELIGNPQFACLIQAVSDDYSSIVGRTVNL